MPQDGQWRVVRAGELFKGPSASKEEAIRAAHLLTLLFPPSHVLIHDLTDDVGGRDVLWHLTSDHQAVC